MKRISDPIILLYRLLLVYVVLFLCRVVFYILNADTLGSLTLAEIPQLIEGSFVFDTVSMLYANSFFILLSLLPFRFRAKQWYQNVLFWIFMVVNSVSIALNFADSVYFHYAKKRFTADEFHFAGNDNNGGLLLKFSADNWYLFIVVALMIWGLAWAYKKVKYNTAQIKNVYLYFGINLLILVAAIPLIIGGIRGGFTRAIRPVTLSNAAQYATTHQKASLILSNPFCVIRTFGSTKIEVPNYFSQAELDSIYSPYHYPDSINKFTPKNVVIFTLESFSREHSALLNPDVYPDGKGFTPFLDSLMNYSFVFNDGYASGRKSIDAMPSILASIPSYKKPFVLLPQSLGEVRALPKLLSEEGYHTAFFCGSERNSMGFAAFASLAGIDNTYMREDFEAVHGTSDFDGAWGIWDEPFLRYMSETLGTFREPFFADVFTLSSHHPFAVPEKYKNTLPNGFTRIHKAVSYTDMALQRFFDYAKTQSWYDNTIFVFVADHVSSEVYADKTNTAVGNGSIIMFMYDPSNPIKSVYNNVAQQLDLMPTILGMLGYEKPYFAYGRDVRSEPDRIPHAINYVNEAFQLTTDSIALYFDGNKRLFVYDKNDVFQKKNINNPSDTTQRVSENLIKAILQQYYKHLNDKSYIVK